MRISVPREDLEETRIALTPKTAQKFIEMGFEVEIEEGLGKKLFISDEKFKEKGVLITKNRKDLLSSADIILRVRKPNIDEIKFFKKGSIHISFLDPFNEKKLIEKLIENDISSISMEMIPRTTICQKMDALSSQANLAGYIAVLIAAEQSSKILPMMTTPCGTIFPSKVFIIGVGVAGLQAIATAKRLGAKVIAFDTREIVEEQVKSLGGKFLKIDLGKLEQTKDGYATALSHEQIEKQKIAMAKTCEESDIVITTAQVFGKKAPRIIDKKIIEKMKPGSIIVDMATESGGNVEGSQIDKISDVNNIKIIGHSQLARKIAKDASELYSFNLFSLIQHFWKKEFIIDLENEIFQNILITHNKKIINQKIKKLFDQG